MSSFKMLVLIVISLIAIISLGIYLKWSNSIYIACLSPYTIAFFWVCEDLYNLPKSERWRW